MIGGNLFWMKVCKIFTLRTWGLWVRQLQKICIFSLRKWQNLQCYLRVLKENWKISFFKLFLIPPPPPPSLSFATQWLSFKFKIGIKHQSHIYFDLTGLYGCAWMFGGLVIHLFLFGDLSVWWFGGLIVLWFVGLVVWLFCGLLVWCFDGFVVCRFGGFGVLLVWWFVGLVVFGLVVFGLVVW